MRCFEDGKVDETYKIKTGHLPEYLVLIYEEYIDDKLELMPVPLEVDIARYQNFEISLDQELEFDLVKSHSLLTCVHLNPKKKGTY